MQLKSLRDMSVTGRQVIVRADFNVPLRDGKVSDPSRILAALPTLEYLRNQQCRIVIITHFGKAKGKVDPAFSLRPAFEVLAERLPGVQFASEVPGTPEAIARSQKVRQGDITLFENLRFHPGEQANDPAFAADLAKMGDCYVNEAFSECHRSVASLGQLAGLLPAAAGFQLEKEVKYLDRILQAPARPMVGIIGGAKISTKLPVIRALLEHVDYLLLGGALANTILKAQGVAVGKSLVEESMVEAVKDLTLTTNKLRIPVDVVIAHSLEPDAPEQTVAVGNVPDDQLILDIGPETVELYKLILQQAATVVWNGPMGYFELPQFAKGTDEVAKFVAGLSATTVVGGGETLDAVNALGLGSNITFASTGGGAMLKFLEGKPLPGIVPLLQNA
ncbi:MAG: phosphoglycerate kinase [Patescibacteria group bacterium]|jgi:phosphoglycerate kinase